MKKVFLLLFTTYLFANDYICLKFDKKFLNEKKELIGKYSFQEKKKTLFKEKDNFLIKDKEAEVYIREKNKEVNIFQGNNKYIVFPKNKKTFYIIEKYKKSNDILRYFCISK